MRRQARIENSVVIEYDFGPDSARRLADIILAGVFTIHLGFESHQGSHSDSERAVADLILTFASAKDAFDIEIPLLRDDVETVVSDVKFIAFHR